MKTDEILKNATPRPWKHGMYGGDSKQGMANSALSKLAVNSYEANQALIGKLVTALEAVMRFCPSYPGEVEVTLAEARKVMPQ